MLDVCLLLRNWICGGGVNFRKRLENGYVENLCGESGVVRWMESELLEGGRACLNTPRYPRGLQDWREMLTLTH